MVVGGGGAINFGGSTGTLATHLSTELMMLWLGELETPPKPLLLLSIGGDEANTLGFITWFIGVAGLDPVGVVGIWLPKWERYLCCTIFWHAVELHRK